ncbi:ATP-dependent sacrificial sulfur transferase LarE [Pseudonocardia abyssalis]|uniref:ATP-dependent sacrificial sulfur transferase LarE n=1 Tax=Pseudonocardia abyssalis TaxID=2792008 RepID=A0ABS6UQG1_9PSEU|nr:ATP-dependent sacrificial sulfur transferase LarE [Pseudonocardia abyssalis]MBW0117857.1 ATP-dependent sacrificial sulfur transferase LarE [Pseudonocardia abyssalis]MBW0134464.1 ATP-dependent sacrificial sulfur transferase LarE [Pseudonocardia abyssalis]
MDVPPTAERLRERVRDAGRLLVAYSGGVDSALVAVVAAQELGSAAVAVTAVSASLPRSERVAAAAFARAQGIAHVEVCTDELERPEYAANDGDRCYHCKSALLDVLTPLATLSGAEIALGTTVDDLGDHRPGQRAAAARGAIAPLVDAGLGKSDVRRISAELGLVTADKPAAACLSSRVAYGEPVTALVLGRIERAEDAVRALGFDVCRVRSHGDGSVARIEVPAADVSRAADLRAELDTAVRAAGFAFCALDLQGFASGRMNVLLGLPAVR